MHPNTTQHGPWAGRTRTSWNTLLGLAPGQCRRALGRRQRLVHGGAAARIAKEGDARARRQRAAPEGGGERGDPGVGDLVAAEVQPLQVGHRPLLDERGQGGHRTVAHLVAAETQLLQLPQPAACVRGAERLTQCDHLRVVPPQLDVEERDGPRHLRGEGPAVDLPHEPHISGIRKLGHAACDARLERRGKRRGRHRRLARGLAVLAHLAQILLLACQTLEADERQVVLDEAARVELHDTPPPPLVRLRVGLLARGEVGVDEEYVRLRVADGRRQLRWAAHLQRSLEGGELLWRAVVHVASPRALRHRHVVEEDAHLAAVSVLLGSLVEDLQHVRDRAELQPVLVRVVSVEPPATQLELVARAHAERRERGRRAIIERLAAGRDQVVAAAAAARLGVQRRLHVGRGPGRAGVEHDRGAVDLDLDLEGRRAGLLLCFHRDGGGDHGGSLAHKCCHRGPQLALRLGFERRRQLVKVGGPRAGLGMQLRRQLDRGGRHLERRLHHVEHRDDKWKPNGGERQPAEGDRLDTLGRGGAGDGDDDTARDLA
eukprot:scaffold14415_cov56-Phaeocystis_antarctica.AAC.3